MGNRVSVRDKMPQQEQRKSHGLTFRTTKAIIRPAERGSLPHKMMITVHPQRWSSSAATWVKELVWQNAKNVLKRALISIR